MPVARRQAGELDAHGDPAEARLRRPDPGRRLPRAGRPLWPRGPSKERAALDLWAEEVAPSTELRKAFPHDDLSWSDFEAAYRAELAGPTAGAVGALRAKHAPHLAVTLLHAVHDDTHHHAVILREALEA